ncbi:UbiX family flavin prenyltransferase [Hydromonas duriensis]|uniref:Flavin prenyltransferase UbiX n=1 Tax=Hydromonas duriensis TaxID=1527608 RepID=A0A4R6Y5T0_9BURK|nr:UbiX family flavin prenyltransferase [Hydromonas duriensis]TDR30585.1 4-hydroxy-3-polyprenylbenzoate decarboxylase [Hydromonas duriensis]
MSEHLQTPKKRLIIAITGATGAVFGIRLLDVLSTLSHIETHLVVSEAGWLTIEHELGLNKDAVRQRADVVHAAKNIGASISSGSYPCDGMIVAPCSMKTLAAIAHGYSDNLISRAADVTLKERRRLTLLVRETPLSLIHLRNMTAITEAGGLIFPPVPAFYHQPKSIDDIVNHTVARVLDAHGIDAQLAPRWSSINDSPE